LETSLAHHRNVFAASGTAVVAPNPGCILQLRYGARRYGPPVEVFHLIDLLDRAYGAA
jgi:glycolate oxidase iron-sulfur subunit